MSLRPRPRRKVRVVAGGAALGLLAAISPTVLPRARAEPAPVPSPADRNDTSAPLADAPSSRYRFPIGATDEEREPEIADAPGRASAQDGVVQSAALPDAVPSPSRSFDGLKNDDNVPVYGSQERFNPPDTSGEAGPNHYVQIVHYLIGVFNKAGVSAPGFPKASGSLWSGFGGPCQNGGGDHVVLYDQLADRWVFSLASAPNWPDGPYYRCLAVSTGSDPGGSYHRYQFLFDNLEYDDYGKLAVWPDAYYLSANRFTHILRPDATYTGATAVAFDRAKMLTGQPATQVRVDRPTTFGHLLPSDLDGARPPPAGTPAYFVSAFGAGGSGVKVYKFHVDFGTSASSTFTGPVVAPASPFDGSMCGSNPSTRCIPQPGTASKLVPQSGAMMFRAAYRNFGDHESIVTNHTVDVDGTDHAGVRWYELRDPGGTPTVQQQGTWSPDADHRFMASIAMDAAGDVGLGYSVSSASTYPSVRYTGRLAGDPPGMLRAEASLVAGGGSQTFPDDTHNWGDYSHMSVDPTDDCTFWYTQEYYATTSDFGWRTRIGSFRFPECSPSTVAFGSAWYAGGSNSESGPSGTTIRAYAVGAFANVPYQLVTGSSGGTSDPCRFNVVPVNASVRFATSSGFIGTTVGTVNRPAGAWSVCFKQLDGAAVTGAVTFTVT